MPVIHDLNFFHFPEYIPYYIRQYYNYFFPRFIGKATRIATVSEYTRNDIMSRFNIERNRIDVVYNGASAGFEPIPTDRQQAVREIYSRGCPYFLFVGLIHPRKNLANLMLAFEKFRQHVHEEVKLLVVGSRKWWTQDMQQAYEGCSFREDILFTGRVPDEELKKITASALGMVYVSYFEGFGIPVLESMNCDVPVICSFTSSLPEVGGEAVLYADPASPDSIKSAMLAIYKDAELRNLLISKGRKQRENFSWMKSADLLWDGIEKCLEV
jgi:glycosyltransferase involved in cell wall biosynthesis